MCVLVNCTISIPFRLLLVCLNGRLASSGFVFKLGKFRMIIVKHLYRKNAWYMNCTGLQVCLKFGPCLLNPFFCLKLVCKLFKCTKWRPLCVYIATCTVYKCTGCKCLGNYTIMQDSRSHWSVWGESRGLTAA